jgi:hypothetical protein
MHIFVADEHPLAVFANTCRRALQTPPSADFHDIAYGREKGGRGERAQMAAVLLFLKGPGLSRSTDESRRHHFGSQSAFDGLRYQVTLLTLRENAHAITYRRFDKRPSSGFVVFRSADECSDHPHHFESELASRTRHASSGQGHHSRGSADRYRKLRRGLVIHGLGWTCRVRKASIPDAPRDGRSAAASSRDPCP